MPNRSEVEQQEKIGPVLGRIASGVFILTATDSNKQSTGMLASWVQQVSFQPPMLTIAVNNSRYLNDWLSSSSRCAVSIVGNNQKHYLKHFGRGFEPGEPAFDGLETSTNDAGIPVLVDSIGSLDCTIQSRVEAGDHTLYVVEVVGATVGTQLEHDTPMVHLRKSGFGY